MAFDEALATRLRDELVGDPAIVERKMFGGIAFMRRGHMCVGVVKSDLLARVGPDRHDTAASQPHARVMDFTGKPMRGFVFVSPEGLTDEVSISRWVAICRSFNDSMSPRT